jgi:hypothetical protein
LKGPILVTRIQFLGPSSGHSRVGDKNDVLFTEKSQFKLFLKL